MMKGTSSSGTPLLLNVFAAFGLCVIVYGAFMHYAK